MHCLFPSLLSHSSKFVRCRTNAKTSLHAHTIHIWRWCCYCCYCCRGVCVCVLESLVTKIAYLLFPRFFSVEIRSSLFLLSECNVRTLAYEQKRNAHKPQQLQNTRIWCHWNWYTWILLLLLPRFFSQLSSMRMVNIERTTNMRDRDRDRQVMRCTTVHWMLCTKNGSIIMQF